MSGAAEGITVEVRRRANHGGVNAQPCGYCRVDVAPYDPEAREVILRRGEQEELFTRLHGSCVERWKAQNKMLAMRISQDGHPGARGGEQNRQGKGYVDHQGRGPIRR